MSHNPRSTPHRVADLDDALNKSGSLSPINVPAEGQTRHPRAQMARDPRLQNLGVLQMWYTCSSVSIPTGGQGRFTSSIAMSPCHKIRNTGARGLRLCLNLWSDSFAETLPFESEQIYFQYRTRARGRQCCALYSFQGDHNNARQGPDFHNFS
jgi:hypothetical protein